MCAGWVSIAPIIKSIGPWPIAPPAGFLIAHFHFTMVGGMLMAWLAGLHFWWPKMTGRMYSDFWSRLAAVVAIVGFIMTFMPQFILGFHGMPRRYPNYAPEFQFLNILSTAGASIQGIGYVMPLFYLPASLFTGRKAGANPWNATGLEWQTPSPPPMHNFDETPIVYFAPYEYSLPNGLGVLADQGGILDGKPMVVTASGKQGVTSGS